MSVHGFSPGLDSSAVAADYKPAMVKEVYSDSGGSMEQSILCPVQRLALVAPVDSEDNSV